MCNFCLLVTKCIIDLHPLAICIHVHLSISHYLWVHCRFLILVSSRLHIYCNSLPTRILDWYRVKAVFLLHSSVYLICCTHSSLTLSPSDWNLLSPHLTANEVSNRYFSRINMHHHDGWFWFVKIYACVNFYKCAIFQKLVKTFISDHYFIVNS